MAYIAVYMPCYLPVENGSPWEIRRAYVRYIRTVSKAISFFLRVDLSNPSTKNDKWGVGQINLPKPSLLRLGLGWTGGSGEFGQVNHNLGASIAHVKEVSNVGA